MIEAQLFALTKAQVDAVTMAGDAGHPLYSLDVHDHLFRPMRIVEAPDAIRFGRATGEKGIGAGAEQIFETDCDIPVLVYVLITGDGQNNDDQRNVAFERADAIANAFILWLWNEGQGQGTLYWEQGAVSFARIDHTYDSNPYAVVSFTIRIGEHNC